MESCKLRVARAALRSCNNGGNSQDRCMGLQSATGGLEQTLNARSENAATSAEPCQLVDHQTLFLYYVHDEELGTGVPLGHLMCMSARK